MEDSPAFHTLREALDQFIITEQWRRAADTYNEIYQLPIAQGDRHQYYYFAGYTSILRDNNIANENDIAFLLTIARTRTIPAEYRAEAGFILGLLYFKLFQEEDSKKAYRRVLELTMTAADRARVIFSGVHELTTAGAVFDQLVGYARSNLNEIPTTPYTGPLPPGTDTSIMRTRQINPDANISPTMAQIYLDASQKVRGEECDYCHVKRDTLNATTGEPIDLKTCARCHFKFYCSATYQKADWSTGHRESCRPLHDPFQVGDVVKIQGY